MPFDWKQFAQTSGFLHASVSAARNLLATLEPKYLKGYYPKAPSDNAYDPAYPVAGSDRVTQLNS